MELRHEYSFHLMIKICKNNTFYCITAKQKYLSKILIIYFTVKRSKCNTNIHALISSFLNTEQFNFYFSKKVLVFSFLNFSLFGECCVSKARYKQSNCSDCRNTDCVKYWNTKHCYAYKLTQHHSNTHKYVCFNKSQHLHFD